MSKAQLSPNNFRDGIFFAPSRTYGEQYIEPIIRHKYKLSPSNSGNFDAKGSHGVRYEIKSSKVLTRNPHSHSFNSLYDAVVSHVEASMPKRACTKKEFLDGRTDAVPNIQNVKRSDFDKMYYCLLFSDCLVIFLIDRDDVETIPGWSGKHGRYDKLGENGQFGITADKLKWHLKKTLVEICSWEEIAKISSEISINPKTLKPTALS